ncbi:MAG: hypothetical protein ACOCUU_03415 [Nanoarchaeota archaeon]
MLRRKTNSLARSPTLDTVLMIEKTIEKFSGEFNSRQIWKKLPKKVMWQTYLVVLDYLLVVNRIAIDRKGILGYIGTSAQLKKLLNSMPEIKT